jgi:predicted extracellular nuclease
VVHFKSKLCLADESPLGPEGCGALARQEEALELTAVASRLPPAEANELLLIGDFNSDSREAASAVFTRAGFIDLLEVLPSAERYSYVFGGRASLLDHAFASPPLAARLARAQIWHINADAPELLDYHLDNFAAAYQPDAVRSSDHDPLVIDLEL